MITESYNGKITPVGSRDFLPALKSIIEKTSEFLIVRHFQVNFGSIFPLLKSSGVWDLLCKKIGAGVRVRFILNSRFPSAAQKNDNDATAELLRKAGIEVIQQNAGRMYHEKMIISDGKRMLIGSHNLTLNALTANSEFSVLIESE